MLALLVKKAHEIGMDPTEKKFSVSFFMLTCAICSWAILNNYELTILTYYGKDALEKQQGGPPYLSYSWGNKEGL